MLNAGLNVCVLGLGYIGLPTAAVLAAGGSNVLGVDSNPKIVESLSRGVVHIAEPGLEELLRKTLDNGSLKVASQPDFSDVFFVAVPTPFKGHFEPDLSYVRRAIEDICPFLRTGNTLIIESTCPVGTTELVISWIAEVRPDLKMPILGVDGGDIYVAYCPERVLPGKTLVELYENDRVIGAVNQGSFVRAATIYRTFVRGEITSTNSRTAEMSKLVENAYRDVNIAFANEVSMICDSLDIDIWELRAMANMHPRVNILQPGIGVGGHCIAVDPWFIIKKTPEQARLIREARDLNLYKTEWSLKKIHDALHNFISENPQKSFSTINVACFGIAFKADVDDLRNSPAQQIVIDLATNIKCQFLVVEPNVHALDDDFRELKNVSLCSIEEAMSCADICVFLVRHSQFSKIKSFNFKNKKIIDFVGIFSQPSTVDDVSYFNV